MSKSKWRQLAIPPVGSHIRANVDPRGFLCSLEVLEPRASTTPDLPSQGYTSQVSARVAVLKAAATFLGHMSQSREEIRSDHVLVLADKWLAWVNSTSEEA